MKVFLAGGSGALGKRLIPRLVAAGHEVLAMTRSPGKRGLIAGLGAEPVVADALDRDAVMQAVVRSEPDAVIHQLTSLAGVANFRRFDREFALTNRLRTEGTDHLLEAAWAAGVHRFIAQSYGSWNYERSGSGTKSEADPFDPRPPRNQTRSLEAIRYLESSVLAADGIVLRYGGFYGPGTDLSRTGPIAELVRHRRFPILGDGGGVWSFVHIDDAACATVAALERGNPGVYNVVDDEPVAVAQWLPELARALGAKPPRRVPVRLGRLVAGEVGVSLMTQIRGASNAKARRELDWSPRYPSYREGFRAGLDGTAAPARAPATTTFSLAESDGPSRRGVIVVVHVMA
jgi:nucleoside-diphosphate-sugar epimerase